MSFHQSASDIRVEDGHILRARLTNMDGEEVEAEMDLNDVIGNNDGSFEWGGSGEFFLPVFVSSHVALLSWGVLLFLVSSLFTLDFASVSRKDVQNRGRSYRGWIPDSRRADMANT